jgi:hypothetical protein
MSQHILFSSSRSHLLFMLKVEGYDTVSKATSRGRLTLVDLAGSERISRSEASGIRLVEAAAINKSLSALGQVGVANKIEVWFMTFVTGVHITAYWGPPHSIQKLQTDTPSAAMHWRRL